MVSTYECRELGTFDGGDGLFVDSVMYLFELFRGYNDAIGTKFSTPVACEKNKDIFADGSR